VTGARLPLTAAQLGIWLGQALDPQSTAYWAAEYVELAGPLEVARFERAHQRALCRVESLHLRFASGEAGPEQWTSQDRHVRLMKLDFSSAVDPSAAARRWMETSLYAPVDLSRGPLFESALLRLGPNRHFWLLKAHHIALDGYAFQLVQARVAAAFTAELSAPSPEERQTEPPLAALVEEDQRYRRSPALARDREFWLASAKAMSPSGSLVPMRPLARSTRHERGEPDQALLAMVTRAAQALQVELSSWLNAAVVAWLARELGSSSYTLGLPVTGRLGSVAAGMPCMAMNIVPLSLRWSDTTTFAQLAVAARDQQRRSRLHQRYRYEDLRQDLATSLGPRRPFGVVVNWMPFAVPAFFGLSARKFPLSAGPVEDLAVAFSPGPDGLRVDIEGNPNAYCAQTLARCRAALLETLTLLAAEPQAVLAALPRADSTRMARAIAHGEPLATAPVPLLQQLMRFAETTPEAHAIEEHGRSAVTYTELRRRVCSVASRLEAAGVRPGDRVALLLPRSIEAVVSQLAVLWLGAAYVPLDPRGPTARTRVALEDTAPRVVLTRGELSVASGFRCLDLGSAADEGIPPAREPALVTKDAHAYTIYTSGSTGKPNGVVISRGALDHFVAAARQRYAFDERDRVLQFAPLAFDASVEEIMVTLGSGGTLVLRSDAMIESLPGFLREVAALQISVLDLPTAFFHELVPVLDGQHGWPASVRLVIIGGEAALGEHVSRFRRQAPPAARLLNTYGPTETTIVCTAALLSGSEAPELDDDLPIGAPLPGVSVAVVDAARQPVAIGDEGELCVLGPTLGNGYWGRDDLTAQRFVRLERLRGAPRAYLTGDRARLSHEGELIYLGRIDEELKISGYRVSPLEVEAALMTLGSVLEAAVVTVVLGGSKRLVAFVVSGDSSPDASRLRSQLSQHVAPAAVPRHVVFLDRLPRDANGKVDRSLLRARAPQLEAPAALVASPAEQQVARIWGEVLGLEIADLDADFFALGGHSLLALRVAERLGRVLGQSVPLSLLFQHSTIRSLTAWLARSSECAPTYGADPLAARVQLSGAGGAPLFCLPPADGLSWCYLGLARHLPHVTLWGLQAPGLCGASPGDFEALVDHYLEQVLATQPRGPYRLLGWSSGGGLAHALSHRLESRGETVTMLALLDAYPSDMWHGKPAPTELDAWVTLLDAVDAAAIAARPEAPTRAELLALMKKPGSSLAHFDDPTLLRMSEVALASMVAYRSARHPKPRVPLTFFRAALRSPAAPEPSLWRPYAASIEIIDVPATHLQMCTPAALASIAAVIGPRL
jgi:amino acid adenylation domain-containing protein